MLSTIILVDSIDVSDLGRINGNDDSLREVIGHICFSLNALAEHEPVGDARVSTEPQLGSTQLLVEVELVR